MVGIVLLAALLGAVLGSFSGVVADRGWRGALRGRSACAGCGRPLRWWELVPVVSWLALRGRCARCGARIPAALLVRELVGALLGVCVALLAGR